MPHPPHDLTLPLPPQVESISHLSPVGFVFTIACTYCGFGLLSAAVLWNADIVGKLRMVRVRWRQLRETPTEWLG